MTYWYLLVVAAVFALLAVTLIWRTDGFMHPSETIATVIMAVVIVSAVGALVSTAAFLFGNLERRSCLEQGKLTGMNVRYQLLSGCYVRVDDRLIPYDRWVQVSGVNAP